MSPYNPVMTKRMKPVEILRPLIKEHFDFLVSKYGFVDSKYDMEMEQAKICCIQYKSKRNPPMEILVGTWFPDFQIELSFSMTDKPSTNPYHDMVHDNYHIEDINRVLNGFECNKIPTHSCYSYDEDLANEVLSRMAPLVDRFIEEVLMGKNTVYSILDRICENDNKKGQELYDNARARHLAGQAWENEDYPAYIKCIESIIGEPTATEIKLVYIAKKTIENNDA